VIDCLRDPDISIRRRALDLTFSLINSSNIRILTRELLSFLETAEADIKASVASKICTHAGRFRPNKRWEVDTVTRVLRVAGAYVDQSVINYFIKLITTGDAAVHQYAVRKLYSIIKTEGILAHCQEGLLQAGFWCFGEYGDILVNVAASSGGFGIEEDGEGEKDSEGSIPTELEVHQLIVSIFKGPYATPFVKEYAITALAKLVGKFKSESVIM
jgi:AP-1 complex subunit gamma-1